MSTTRIATAARTTALTLATLTAAAAAAPSIGHVHAAGTPARVRPQCSACATRLVNTAQAIVATPALGGSCAGQPASYWQMNWYGPSFYANECQTTTIYNDLRSGYSLDQQLHDSFFCGNAKGFVAWCVGAVATLYTVAIATEHKIETHDHGRGVWFSWWWGAVTPFVTSA